MGAICPKLFMIMEWPWSGREDGVDQAIVIFRSN